MSDDLLDMREAWVSRDEAMQLTGLCIRSLYQRIAEESWHARPSNALSQNGKPIPEIAVSSLPKAAQALYWTTHLVPPAELQLDPLNLAEIPEILRVEARRRLAVLEQAEPLFAGPRGLRREALAQFCADRDLTPSTLYQWRQAYQRGGIGALLPKWGKTRGQFLALSTPIQRFIKDDYCSPQRPSPTTVYRHVLTLCEHLHEPIPSQATVNRYLLTLPQPAIVLAREGPRAFRAKMEPKCHRDLNALAPNEVWCGDHRESDVLVRLHDGPDAKIFRPWGTFWLDLGTRTCVGWHIALVPNSDTIALALRAGIIRFGVPQELYIDNGKDYRCHYLNGSTKASRNVQLSADLADSLQPGVLSPLGVLVRHATPYQPWSKPIEPWFGHTFPEWEKTLPGWCGRNAQARPEKLAGELKRGELLTLAEFTERLAARLDEYHHAENPALGAAPIATWRGVDIVRPNPRTLDLLLMRQRSVRVYAQGIKLHGRHYWHDALIEHVGHTVDVRFGQDLGRIVVFAGGAFLCEALDEPAMKMGATREDLAALQRRKQLARKRTEVYLADRGVLLNQDRELARLAAESRARKVVVIQPPEPTPPGVRPVPKMLPALDHAANAIAQQSAAEAAAVPTGAAASLRRGRRQTETGSRVTAGSPSRPAGPQPSREDLLNELVSEVG